MESSLSILNNSQHHITEEFIDLLRLETSYNIPNGYTEKILEPMLVSKGELVEMEPPHRGKGRKTAYRYGVSGQRPLECRFGVPVEGTKLRIMRVIKPRWQVLGLEFNVLEDVIENWNRTAFQHPLDGIIFVEINVPWAFFWIPPVTADR